MVFSIQNVDLTIDEKKILNNLNIEFEEHKFNAIIGPNGCGKSSLIKLFARINIASKGKILFLNQELEKIKRKDFAKKVSFFFQFNDNINEITVEQIVAFGRSAHKNLYENLNDYDIKVINECIDKCDLNELKGRLVASLSGGERQRAYLAMTLAQEPEVIVLDEPTNHLDIKYQYQILNLIREIMEEKNLTIICILHDLNQVFKYADNTLIMSAGKVVTFGKTGEVITVEMVKQVFGVDSIIHTDGNGYHIDFIV